MKKLTIVLLLLAIALTGCNKTDDFTEGMTFFDKKDYKNALPLFEKLAEQGNAKAQNVLAVMYINGQGLPKDIKKAMIWYEKAAALGNDAAQYNLGIIYDLGENNIPQDYKKAAYWYEKAAALGRAEAQYNLGAMYIKGKGVSQNYEQGVAWIKKAASKGDEMAQKFLEAPKVYQFSDKEKFIIKSLIKDDLITYIGDGDSLLKYNNLPVNVNANKMQRDYEKNEVAGDIAYRKKCIIVNGKVASIDRSIGENYFITLKGGSNQFISPHAKMDDGYKNYLAALNKGDEVSLVCTGTGMLMGSATLKDCMPLNDWTNVFADEYIKGISRIIESKDENVVMLATIAVFIVSQAPDNTLFTDDADKDQIVKEIYLLINNIPKDERKKIFAEIAAEKFNYVKVDKDNAEATSTN